MWQPEPGWERLPGAGPSTLGTWRTVEGGRVLVVKRLAAPTPHDPPELSTPTHPAYWRRAAEVAASGVVETTSGVAAPPLVRLEEDPEGITIVHSWVEAEPLNGLFLARAVGRLASQPLPRAAWLAHDQLGERLAQVNRRGGWATLARTPVADVADLLWRRREVLLARLASHRQVLQHGDPVPSNLRGRRGDDVLAIDWACLGAGPAGADLGYLSLNVREEFEPLLAAYLEGLDAGADPAEVQLAAQVTAVFTVLTRADWALTRVAAGEGALGGKFRHPSVAPYLRAMQRQFPQIEALVAAV